MKIIAEKLILRSWHMDDAPSLAEHANNKKVWDNLRDQFPHPYTLADAREWIKHCEKQTPTLNFAIVVDYEAVGGIGLTPQHDIHRKNMEIGFWLSEAYWKQGIMSEAIQEVCVYVKDNFTINRLYGRIFSTNKASQRALRKNGFKREAVLKNAIYKKESFIDEVIYTRFF